MTKTTHKTSQSAPINKYRRGKISSDKTRSNAGARRIERKNNLELKNARRSSLRIGAGGLGLLGSGGGGFLALPLRRLVFALEQIRLERLDLFGVDFLRILEAADLRLVLRFLLRHVVGIVELVVGAGGLVQVLDEPHPGNGHRTGAHDQLELDILVLAPAEAKVQVDEFVLAERQRADGVALLLVAEIVGVKLDHVALACDGVGTQASLLEHKKVVFTVFVGVVFQLQDGLIARPGQFHAS